MLGKMLCQASPREPCIAVEAVAAANRCPGLNGYSL